MVQLAPVVPRQTEPEQTFARLAPMVDDRLVELGDGEVEVTEPGRFFIRNVCMTFDRHLGGAGEAQPVYSRTV